MIKNNDFDTYLDVQQASKFLKLRPQTIYQKIWKKELPYYKPDKKLYFKKSDLINYIEGK